MVTAAGLLVTIAMGIGGVRRGPSTTRCPLRVAGSTGGGGVEAKGHPSGRAGVHAHARHRADGAAAQPHGPAARPVVPKVRRPSRRGHGAVIRGDPREGAPGAGRRALLAPHARPGPGGAGTWEAETLPHFSAAGGGLGEHKGGRSQNGDPEEEKEKRRRGGKKKKTRKPAGRKKQAGGDPKLRTENDPSQTHVSLQGPKRRSPARDPRATGRPRAPKAGRRREGRKEGGRREAPEEAARPAGGGGGGLGAPGASPASGRGHHGRQPGPLQA